MVEKNPNGDFTLDDFMKQLDQVKKIGMKDMISRLPGMEGMVAEGEDPEAAMARITGMISSMTKEGRSPTSSTSGDGAQIGGQRYK